MNLPNWTGEAIPHVLARSEDAEFIFEEELDWPWWYAEVPAGDFPDTNSLLVEEEKRCPPIQEWVRRDHEGDWLSALRASPLLVVLGNPKCPFELADGWHRLKLARQAGLDLIPVCYTHWRTQ